MNRLFKVGLFGEALTLLEDNDSILDDKGIVTCRKLHKQISE